MFVKSVLASVWQLWCTVTHDCSKIAFVQPQECLNDPVFQENNNERKPSLRQAWKPKMEGEKLRKNEYQIKYCTWSQSIFEVFNLHQLQENCS